MLSPATEASAASASHGSNSWLTAERLTRVRAILLALTLFFALAVWILYSVGFVPPGAHLAAKLRALGAMTWLYALVQLLDHRFWNSRYAQRRRATLAIPESLFGWLLGQMLAWFGIVYYGLTEDLRWYVAGLAILLLSFLAFPIRREP
jgi:hypothetical protein